MADIVPMPEFEDMTEFERDLVGKAVRVEISLRNATRVEIREVLGIYARALQDCIVATHDIKSERTMRTTVAFRLKQAQDDALVYRRQAAERARGRADARQRERDGR